MDASGPAAHQCCNVGLRVSALLRTSPSLDILPTVLMCKISPNLCSASGKMGHAPSSFSQKCCSSKQSALAFKVAVGQKLASGDVWPVGGAAVSVFLASLRARTQQRTQAFSEHVAKQKNFRAGYFFNPKIVFCDLESIFANPKLSFLIGKVFFRPQNCIF